MLNCFSISHSHAYAKFSSILILQNGTVPVTGSMKAEFCTPLSVSLLPCYSIGFGSVQLKNMPDIMSLRALEIMVDH